MVTFPFVINTVNIAVVSVLTIVILGIIQLKTQMYNVCSLENSNLQSCLTFFFIFRSRYLSLRLYCLILN